jgi:hypothetical protein
MRKIILIYILCTIKLCKSQDYFYIDAAFQTYKKINDSIGKYKLDIDTSKTVTYNTFRNYVKIFQYDTLLEEGYISWCCIDCKCRGNEWIYYYKNGKIKETGDYYRQQKINDWKYYYETGKLKKFESIFFDLDGIGYYSVRPMLQSEYEYYENGQLKMEGQYEKSYDGVDSIYMVEPETGKETLQTIFGTTCSKKCGTWNYYNPDGSLMRKEEY